MLCMHELAFTRSEPETKMNTLQPKPDALEVQHNPALGPWQSHSKVPSLDCHMFYKHLDDHVIHHLE